MDQEIPRLEALHISGYLSSVMEYSIFVLGVEARRRFIQCAARVLGCSYICIWSPIHHLTSNHLSCMEGWFEDGGRPSSSSGSLSSRLFDSYRGSLCPIESCCVPGLAFKGGIPYIELVDSDLMKFALIPIQRQFYHEAGIKKAVFMGCRSGAIELGMTNSNNINMEMNIQQVFSEDFIQQFQLEDAVIPADPQPSSTSSSSSSLRSLSVGSPDYLSVPVTHQMIMQAYGRHRTPQLPTPMSDDAAMTRAMLAVLSATSSSSSSPPSTLIYRQMQQDQAYHRSISEAVNGAFKAYDSSLAPKFGAKQSSYGQRMIKMGINILRRLRMMKSMGFPATESRPTSNQLHHMISERKRREKLNESFLALRMLLPPGSKKDKASVLMNTKNYLNSLKSKVSELQERNRMLEMQLQPSETSFLKQEEMQLQPIVQEGEGTGHHSAEQVQVHVSRMPESTSEAFQIKLRLMVREECDMIVLVLSVLECLKGMSDTSLISMDASTRSPQASPYATVNFILQIKASDWDEESFKEAVARAANLVVTKTP